MECYLLFQCFEKTIEFFFLVAALLLPKQKETCLKPKESSPVESSPPFAKHKTSFLLQSLHLRHHKTHHASLLCLKLSLVIFTSHKRANFISRLCALLQQIVDQFHLRKEKKLPVKIMLLAT